MNAAFKGQGFPIQEEVYQFKDAYSRDKLHVLLSVDLEKSDFDPQKRRFLPARLADKDFPMAWIKPYGQGRVYYTAFGHAPEIFSNPGCCSKFPGRNSVRARRFEGER